MCGLIGVKNLIDDTPVNQIVRTLYENQKARGTDGFGFVGLTKKNIGTYRATTEKGIVKYLDNIKFDEILFHHRFPTSTDNTIPTTHPFRIDIKSKGKRYYFAHNGIVNNDEELFDKHLELGIVYESLNVKDGSFNDSESLAWEFCLWLNGMIDKFEAKGSVAFLCLELNELNQAKRFYFYRNQSASLKLFRSKQYLQISSEGGGEEVRANRVYYYDYDSKQIKKFNPLVIENGYVFTEYHNSQYDSEYDDFGCYKGYPTFENKGRSRSGYKIERYKGQDEIGNLDTTLKQNKLPIIDVSDDENTPPFFNSDDEKLLKSVHTLRDILKTYNEELSFLITSGNGNTEEIDDLYDDVEEIKDLINECNKYFNSPSKTPTQRRGLLREITGIAFGY